MFSVKFLQSSHDVLQLENIENKINTNNNNEVLNAATQGRTEIKPLLLPGTYFTYLTPNGNVTLF